MAPEPHQNAEKRLKAFARLRREEAGDAFEMHPATRKLLQGEVARVYGRPAPPAAARARLFFGWRPRLWVAEAFVVVLLVGVLVVPSFLPRRGVSERQVARRNPLPASGAGPSGTVLSAAPAEAARSREELALNDSSTVRETPAAKDKDLAKEESGSFKKLDGSAGSLAAAAPANASSSASTAMLAGSTFAFSGALVNQDAKAKTAPATPPPNLPTNAANVLHGAAFDNAVNVETAALASGNKAVVAPGQAPGAASTPASGNMPLVAPPPMGAPAVALAVRKLEAPPANSTAGRSLLNDALKQPATNGLAAVDQLARSNTFDYQRSADGPDLGVATDTRRAAPGGGGGGVGGGGGGFGGGAAGGGLGGGRGGGGRGGGGAGGRRGGALAQNLPNNATPLTNSPAVADRFYALTNGATADSFTAGSRQSATPMITPPATLATTATAPATAAGQAMAAENLAFREAASSAASASNLDRMDSPRFQQATLGDYARLDNRTQYRTNLLSPPVPSVLTVFHVQLDGRQIQFVDQDGSVYAGTAILTPGLATSQLRMELAKQAVTATASNLYFHVTGTNKTLNQSVVFDGTFQPPFPQTPTGAFALAAKVAATGEGTNALFFRQPSAQKNSPAAASRISGTVRLSGNEQFEIEAAPVKP